MSCNPSKLCIRVRYNGQIKCLELDWQNISYDEFAMHLVSTFDVKIQPELDPVWVLTDNLDMRITKNQFENVVKTFHAGSMFYINADLQSTSVNGLVKIVTPLMLENYFIQHNKSDLLLLRKKNPLNETTFRAISNQLADFAVDAFGFDGISLVRKKMIAQAAISLFDGMKHSCSKGDGMEKITGHNSKFSNRLKYLLKRQREQRQHEATESDGMDEEQMDDVERSNPEDDLIYLKEAIIDQIDDSIIKEKLNSTRTLRQAKMADAKFDIRESLPFFLSHPKLIAMDFELSHQEENANALIDIWPHFSQRLREICTSEDKYKFTSTWSKDIEDILCLLKVLPSKGKSHEKLFSNVCKKLISFCVSGTPPDKMINKANISPYIVATGLSQKEIIAFYIVVEQHLIPLPREFEAIDVFDMLFKTHIVLNMNFDVNLSNMMTFLQALVYKFREGKTNIRPSPHMLQIFDQLNANED